MINQALDYSTRMTTVHKCFSPMYPCFVSHHVCAGYYSVCGGHTCTQRGLLWGYVNMDWAVFWKVCVFSTCEYLCKSLKLIQSGTSGPDHCQMHRVDQFRSVLTTHTIGNIMWYVHPTLAVMPVNMMCGSG